MLDSTFLGENKPISYSVIATYHDNNKAFKFNYLTYKEALDVFVDKCEEKGRHIAVLGSGEITIQLIDNVDNKVVRSVHFKSEKNL
jgi:dihydrofolate reductase